MTGKEYKKDRQYIVESRVCIGKMIDEKNMNPNDNFYIYYEIVGGKDEILPRHSDAVQIGAPLLLTSIMDDLKITELLEAIHGTEAMNLIRDIVSYMIIREITSP